MSAGRRALLRFGLLVLFALALQGIPFLYMMMEGDAGVVLYLLHLYAVMPMSAAGLAFWAGLGGVHPMAAFFPVGGALLGFALCATGLFSPARRAVSAIGRRMHRIFVTIRGYRWINVIFK